MHSCYRFFTQILRLTVFSCAVILSAIAHSAPVQLVREYTYNASENDSKVSARQAALEQLQRAAIEEVGIQVQSSFSNSESFKDGELKQQVLSNFNTFSQAVTRSRIIAEKWDGEHFYLKAEIEVDPDGVSTAISALMSGQHDMCKTNLAAAQSLLKKPASLQRNQELVDLALTTHFDEECNQWQYAVLSSLTHYTLYPIEEYKPYLLNELKQAKDYDLPNLLPKVMQYLVRHQGRMSEQEWQLVLAKVPLLSNRSMYFFISSLVDITAMKTQSWDLAPKTTPSAHLQPFEQFQSQINDLIYLAEQQKLTTPSLSKVSFLEILMNYSRNYPDLILDLYLAEADLLKHSEISLKTIPSLYVGIYEKDREDLKPKASKAIRTLLNGLDPETLSSSSKKSFYQLLNPLINSTYHNNQVDYSYLETLLKEQAGFFASIIEANKSKHGTNKVQNLLLIRYDLPNQSVCRPLDCAQALFNNDLNNLEKATYLDYLKAYGSRASKAQDLMIKLLERAQYMPSSSYRTQAKSTAIQLLGDMRITDTQAIRLLIKQLEDLDYRIPDDATLALAKIALPAFEQIQIDYPSASDLSKRRMVNALANMPYHKAIREFLLTLQDSKAPLKFAVEDALLKQSES